MKKNLNIFLTFIAVFSQQARSDKAPSCYEGTYKVDGPPWGQCAGFRACEPGYYCQQGMRFPCPAGTYGASTGLTDPNCSGTCPQGYFCPSGTISNASNPCAATSLYCPEGSAAPRLVPPGYFPVSPDGNNSEVAYASITLCPFGSYCQNGIQYLCPGGTYGDTEGLQTSDCSGLCPTGFFCPLGTTAQYLNPCDQQGFYCPSRSERPLGVREGYYSVPAAILWEGRKIYISQQICEPGYYCVAGQQLACPAGYYGSAQGEINPFCTGLCLEGYFCPPASFSFDQNVCGDASVFCPEGSAEPTPVSVGYYTYGEGIAQAECEEGFYCIQGKRHPCPPGWFGNQTRLSSAVCSGKCPPGYFCPEGAVNPSAKECGGPNVFCPEGSPYPQAVAIGFFTSGGLTNSTHSSETRCRPGTYCVDGEVYLCPSGTYGETYGLANASCSGKCAAGYFCPEGSQIDTQVQCGDPLLFCPEGSSAPSTVTKGYFSIGGNITTRSSQKIASPGQYALKGLVYTCPAGTYGATYGLSVQTCSGKCSNGFFCPPGSTSKHQHICGGPDKICPLGSANPLEVEEGFYTSISTDDECPPGYFRNYAGVKDSFSKNISAIVTSVPQAPCNLCPPGTYKTIEGDPVSLCLPCNSWTSTSTPNRLSCDCFRLAGGQSFTALYFNITSGQCQNVPANFSAPDDISFNSSMYTRYTQYPCEPGFYCINGVRYPCNPGFYGSQALETQVNCSGKCSPGYYCLEASNSPTQHKCNASHLYCPEGSFTPTFVSKGYYTNEDVNPSIRSYQTICPPGYFCKHGLRFQCPSGFYGASPGLEMAHCSGKCFPGFYCQKGSSSPKQFECGGPSVFCPPGSSAPSPVKVGFYTIHTGLDAKFQEYNDPENRTNSAELLCEPGNYCSGGIKQPCPEGVYGWEFGLTNSSCNGPCSEGFHCPMGSTEANQEICGTSTEFCPLGTGLVVKNVRAGFYTIGGDDTTNNTRIFERQCEPGFFCINGIKLRCPPGTFGRKPGLKSEICSGWCPAGFFCPIGTAEPIACPDGTYSSAAAFECIKCPGVLATTSSQRCTNSRKCCSY